ncbi:MAG: hypothetical protein LH473_10110 [Chitinophagales bacterium]|nr:hypothetical protein [Chitinophagales bacterium]
MKKLFFLLCFFVCVKFSTAQTFAPVGSIWYYNHEWFSGNNNEDYTRIESIADTIIEGRLCSIVHIENAYQNATGFPDSIYLFYDSGKVYRYFNDFNKWGLQFDFTAEIGDTILIYGNVYNSILDSFNVIVDSIGYIDINGHSLKTLNYNESSLYWEDAQKVIEEIGGTFFLFPTYTLAENTNDGLRCYSDSLVGYYNSGLVQTCDTVINSVEYVGNLTYYSIYPALFDKEILVTNHTNKDLLMQIFNETLSKYGEYNINANQSTKIDLEILPDGIYFTAVNNGNQRNIQKILKTSTH